MSVYGFWKCVVGAFALAWAVPVGIVLAAKLARGLRRMGIEVEVA